MVYYLIENSCNLEIEELVEDKIDTPTMASQKFMYWPNFGFELQQTGSEKEALFLELNVLKSK